MKGVDKRKHVGLQANATCDEADGATGSGCGTARLRGQSYRQTLDSLLCDPAARLDVQPHQVGMQLFLFGDEVAHYRAADLSAEEAHRVKKRGERQHAVGRIEATGSKRLQDRCADEADERERL